MVEGRHKVIPGFSATMVNPEQFMGKTRFDKFENVNRTISLKGKDTIILDVFYHNHRGPHRHFDV